MKKNNFLISILTLLGLSITAQNVHAISFDFDYRFDTRGFFTDQLTGAPIVERRQALSHAASFYSGFSDSLTSINASPSDTWSVSFTHPSLAGSPITLTDEFISNDTLKIFVGGSTSAPGVLGFANTGYNLIAQGSQEFIENVTNRGQGNNDYGVWGGQIWFNAVHDWHFEIDDNGLTPGNPDFLTTAIHEIGHILGFGTADSWQNKIDNDGFFTGVQSVSKYGSGVPTDPFNSHWAEGITSEYLGMVQETLMDPSTPRGERQLLTDLDYAGFADIGWQHTPVPIPAAIWLFASAFSGLIITSRNKIR